MPKRQNDDNASELSNNKVALHAYEQIDIELEPGEILRDLCGKEWILGKLIGFGGFGVIHEVSERESKSTKKFVVKIEKHTNGPLFTEINCYLRIGKKEMSKSELK